METLVTSMDYVMPIAHPSLNFASQELMAYIDPQMPSRELHTYHSMPILYYELDW